MYLPQEWHKLNFDKIIICVENYKTKLEMMNQLLELGVEKERIGFIEEFSKIYNIRITVEGKGKVKIWKDEVVVLCENEIEYMIAQEIFAGEAYGFHVDENYYVIDIGMNIGCASLYFASQSNVTSVYGFEPCKGVYDKAILNIAMNKNEISKKVYAHNIGLSANDGSEEYIIHDDIYESAGVKKVQDGVKHNAQIMELNMMQASRILGEIMDEHKEKCLMKIDCEGAEYGIFDDLISSGYMEKIDVIIMEWHVGKYKQLENMLKQAGFTYVLNKSSRDYGMCYAWRG